MSKRALVVDLDMLESCRDLFREMAKGSHPDRAYFADKADMVDRIIRYGTTVDVLEPGGAA